jgi:DNA (cytosine-5)-methyltransferase 1
VKPRLLDLFCGAGGAAMGYHRAGFEVVGLDIKPQPNYPFEFAHADALAMCQDCLRGCWHEHGKKSQLDGMLARCLGHFDAIHASPPCQAYANISKQQGTADRHPRLIEPTRELLIASGLPYVIENVPGAPLRNPIQLCGSSFRLRVRRHRLFECSFPVMAPPCAHGWQRSNTNRLRSGYVAPEDSVVPVYGGGQAGFTVATCREAMGIDWMTTDELNDAIPPAYTEHIGGYLLAAIRSRAAA